MLKHETGHARGKYTREDLEHDNQTPIDWEVLKFMWRYPKTLIQLLPIYRVRGIWRINWFALVGWLIVVIVYGLLAWFMYDRGLL